MCIFAKFMTRIDRELFFQSDVTEKRAKVKLQKAAEKFNFRK